jgi:hypothetical protein
MKVLVVGHQYEVDNFESGTSLIQFIHKEPSETDNTRLVTVSDGTTNEELLRVLIDRTEYLNSKFPCRENSIAITKMQEALMWFEKRTADRVRRNVEGKHIK